MTFFWDKYCKILDTFRDILQLLNELENNFTFFIILAFLAHLSRRLKWAIVIARRPFVRCRPASIVRKLSHFQLLLQNRLMDFWILMKLGRDEVLMVPYKCCCFSARSAQGRIQGGAKIGHGGPLLQETSSDRKATATNRMHSNDLEACGKKCCYFCFHSGQIFDAFLTFFWTKSFLHILMQFL